MTGLMSFGERFGAPVMFTVIVLVLLRWVLTRAFAANEAERKAQAAANKAEREALLQIIREDRSANREAMAAMTGAVQELRDVMHRILGVMQLDAPAPRNSRAKKEPVG